LLQQAIELMSSVYKDQGDNAKSAALITQYQHEMGLKPAR
jgi:hypothetical protein